MAKCLVGYTGTVGKNLMNQMFFDDLYNSKNIEEIECKKYDEMYLSCLPATKWLINKNPEEDDKNTKKIIDILSTVDAKYVILISTIDVYPNKNNRMKEDDLIDNQKNDTYGKNRYIFENFVREHFKNYIIVRLPGLFGDYLKKNVIYDLLNDNNIDKINLDSSFQWYFLDNLCEDIKFYKERHINVINLFTEPVSNLEIIQKFFPEKEALCKGENKAKYDLCSKYNITGYIQNKSKVLDDLEIYLDRVRLCRYLYGGMSNFIFSNIAWDMVESDQVINMLKEHGMNKVELALTKFYNWDELNEEKVLKIKDFFTKRQMYIYSLQSVTFGLSYNLHDESRDKLLVHLKRVIKYAKILGCRLIVFGSPKNRSFTDNYDENSVLDFFRDLNKTAEENNIIVCIEPNARIYNCNFLYKLDQAYEFVKKLGCSHIKMMADTGCMSFENDSVYDIYKYKDLIEHVHISEQYLDTLTNKNIDHREMDKILIDCGKSFVTVEMRSMGNNIFNLYKTINFVKKNYVNLIAVRNNL